MKKVLCLTLVLLFVLCTFTVPAYAKTKTMYVFEKCNEYNSQKKVVATHHSGDKVTVVDKKGNWYKLKNGNFISASYVFASPLEYYIAKYDDIIFVSIDNQAVRYYKNGVCVKKNSCITGHIINSPTPKGLFTVGTKEYDYDMNGNPNTHVMYFTRFCGGIGFHDASWRHGKFGGKIYKTNGSHGCVNSPLSLAKFIYFNSTEGKTKVLVF